MLLAVSTLTYLPGNSVLSMPMEHDADNGPIDMKFPHIHIHEDVLSDMNACPNTAS